MYKRIDIIDGKEVEVKVYATRPLPKKCTARLRNKSRSKTRKMTRKQYG